VLVPSWTEALKLLSLLRKQGYGFDPQECPWFKADFDHGRREYGQIILSKAFDTDFCRIDVHFGTYSIGFDRYLNVDLPRLAEATPAGPPGLDATGTLLVMFSHALSDGYVSVKDVNDAAAMARSDCHVDWPRLADELTRHLLSPQASLLADHLASRFDNVKVVDFARRLGAAARTRPGSSLWQVHNRNWRRRALVNASYALRASVASGRLLPGALWKAVQCFGFYVRRLRVGHGVRTLPSRLMLSIIPKTDLYEWRLRPDACAMLVHAEHPALNSMGAVGFDVDPHSVHATPAEGISAGLGARAQPVVMVGEDVFAVTWDLHVDMGRPGE
jgi:hypothetical protein